MDMSKWLLGLDKIVSEKHSFSIRKKKRNNFFILYKYRKKRRGKLSMIRKEQMEN
jgi:hypothetical protein